MTAKQTHELKIAREASITLGGGVVSGVFRYIFNITVARMLGMEYLGFYAIGNAVTQVSTMVGKLGLDVGVVRYVSRRLAMGDKGRAMATVRQALRLGLISALVGATILIFAAEDIATQFFDSPGSPLGRMLRLFGVAVAPMAVALILASASQGFKVLTHRALGIQIFPSITILILFLLLVKWVPPVWSIGLAFIGSQLVSVIAAAFLFFRLTGGIAHGGEKPDKGLLRFSVPLLFAGLLGMLLFWSDILMLGALSGIETAGLYQPAVRTAGLITIMIASFGAIFSPIVAGLHAEKKWEEIKKLLQLITRWTLAISGPSCLFLLLYSPKVALLFGAEFLAVADLIRILAVGQVILSLSVGNAMLITMTGHSQITMVNNLLTLAVNVTGNLILIPIYGPLGVAITSVISSSVLALLRLAEVWVLMRLNPFTAKQVKPLAAGLLAFGAGFLANNFIYHWHTVTVLLLGGGIFGLTYLGALFLLGFEAEDREVWQAVLRKISGRQV